MITFFLLTEKKAIIVLTVLYAVGAIAIGYNLHSDFARLSPLNLLLTTALMLAFHQPFGKKMRIFAMVAMLWGFFVEVVGVKTGLIFGHYHYDFALGYKVLEVPLILGVNWLLIFYCSAMVVHRFFTSFIWWLNAILAAALMVGLDFLIEPVAMRIGFWSWQDDVVPLQNYVGWFVCALPLSLFFFRFIGFSAHFINKVAIWVFLLQVFFFLFLQFIVQK